MKNLSEEKQEWLKEVGAIELEEPMKYSIGVNWIYSERYLMETPLKEIKEKYDERLVRQGEPTVNDNDLDR